MSSSSIQIACAAVKFGAISPSLCRWPTSVVPYLRGPTTACTFDSATCICTPMPCALARSRQRDDERVAAMMRDGRAERGPHLLAVPDQFSIRSRQVARLTSYGVARIASAFSRRPAGIASIMPGDRAVERGVRHHRRDHRAHADVGIGARHRVDAVDRRRRNFRREVVAGGAALLQHLQRADLRREILGLGGAAARCPGIGVQQQFERPAVRHRLAERDGGVGVGVDQARDQQAVGRVDRA